MLFKATLFTLSLLAYVSALPTIDVNTLEKRDTIKPTLYTGEQYSGRSYTITIDTQHQCCRYELYYVKMSVLIYII